MTLEVNVPDNDQPDILSEMLAAARASRGTVDGSPYSSGRQDEIDERQYANEWQMASDALAHDENQALRMLARTRANDSAYSAWMTAQWFEARRKQHAAEARAVAAERQLAEALKDSAYEHEALLKAQAERDEAREAARKLSIERLRLQSEYNSARAEAQARSSDTAILRRHLATANERIAELEAAVIFAEPAPVERAGPDLATAHAITAHDPTFWFRRCTLLERERAELCAQVARLEAAGGDKPAAAAPAEPPAPDKVTRHLLDLKVSEMAPLEALTKLMELKRMALEAAPDDDEPTLASLGDRKAQQGRTVDVPPLKRELPKAG